MWNWIIWLYEEKRTAHMWFLHKTLLLLPWFDKRWQSTQKISSFIFRKGQCLSKLRRSPTDCKKQKNSAFSLMTLKLQSLRLGSPASGTCICISSVRDCRLRLSAPATQALNNNGFPLQEALWWNRGDGCQSLKDDSLSELLVGTSWSFALLVPPSGTAASGVLHADVRERLIMLIM